MHVQRKLLQLCVCDSRMAMMESNGRITGIDERQRIIDEDQEVSRRVMIAMRTMRGGTDIQNERTAATGGDVRVLMSGIIGGKKRSNTKNRGVNDGMHWTAMKRVTMSIDATVVGDVTVDLGPRAPLEPTLKRKRRISINENDEMSTTVDIASVVANPLPHLIMHHPGHPHLRSARTHDIDVHVQPRVLTDKKPIHHIYPHHLMNHNLSQRSRARRHCVRS